MIIKDKFALGVLVGIVATIPQVVFNFILVQLGFSDYYDFQISGGIYLHKYLTYTCGGLIFGGLIWEFTAAGLGIAGVYVIQKTGRAYWWLKGIGIAVFMFLATYGYLYALGGPTIVPWDLTTNWSLICDHLVFGLSMGYLVKLWGE